ncbi:LacI family transcriptional regulator [Sphingomonas oleivorans]|uniref:LacI family transcriptional regulator n=1 Tax=Sphingomonas oleivorans TaxID=1735121 RepID=A0A2T5FUP4_9SPHN|nr:LacI family DNA-binding transcriptional regulator [Sphingomonas oleivorans]PTQ08244.1 LacI family transcriptional regulator [Sphingomonas oleivorans]
MTGRCRPPSSIEVARVAGVSQSAVSRTFTPGASVSAETRAKVKAAADALGYRPNLIPRIMLTDRSGIVAVVVGGFYNPFHAMTLEAFARALRAAGKQVMLVQVESDRALDEVVGELSAYRVDAVVSALSIHAQDVADALSAFRIPIVTLNSAITTEWIRTVSSDNEGAGEAAAALLYERGGRRFGYIAGPQDSIAQTRREAGFRRGLARLGVGQCASSCGNYDHGGGYAAIREMFAGDAPPDALFCVNDLTALGAIDALRIEFGLQCPTDVLVVGYDNIAAAAWPAYQLTTFDQNVEEMVARAIDMIDADLAGTASCDIVQPMLVERSTTQRA